MEIIYVPYAAINKGKWDACINSALHPCLYVTSIYADAMAGKWDALILGDYQTVMPLYARKKAGIKYLCQPAFLPHGGIFSASPITIKTTEAFIGKALEIFNFADIGLAYPVQVGHTFKHMRVQERNNFVVHLALPYPEIRGRYAPGFTKSLNRLKKLSLQYMASEDIKEVTDLFKSLYLDKIAGLENADVKKMAALCKAMQVNNNTIIRKAYSSDKELLCAVILLKYRDRLYNMISCITTAGKKAEANYFLYDKIMEEFSGKGMALDLEGSDIKGVADFYRKMSPENEPSCSIRYNNLPPLLKLFKK